MDVLFDQCESLKIVINKNGIRGLLSFRVQKDNSLMLLMPKIFFNADHYISGEIDFQPNESFIQELELSEKNGFLISKNEPKISFHPTGQINTSFYSSEDSHKTKKVIMDEQLGNLESKTIAILAWNNIGEFELNPVIKLNHKVIEIEPDYEINNLYAFLKCSYSLNDLIGQISSEEENIKNALLEISKEEISKLKDGKFIFFPYPIKNLSLSNGGVNFIINNNLTFSAGTSILFGSRDTVNFIKGEQKIIWYLLTFINPKDFSQELNNPFEASFTFETGLKNWQHEDICKVGRKVIFLGTKQLK